MSITNLYPAVGRPELGETSTIILGKVESYLVVARRVEGPDRGVLAIFPCAKDVISQNDYRRVIAKEVIS